MTCTHVKEQIGINLVNKIVTEDWESGWQEYSPHNDDAIDGMILMRRGSKRPTDTGGIVYVQVKCGTKDGYRQDKIQYPDYIGVQLGQQYIDEHRPRWARVPGPAVLIFVDCTNKKTPQAWWTDLKNKNSYSPTNRGMILISKSQRFAHHSKSNFHKLCGYSTVDRLLEDVKLSRSDLLMPRLGRNESLRNDAWEFYKKWRGEINECTNPKLGRILVNRIGWKHITRKSRLPERIVQSWLLLGAAKEIIRTCKNIFNLGHAQYKEYADGNKNIIDYIGLRANVSFPHRHQSVLQVILRRSRWVGPQCEKQKIWFYSVYEMRRGSNLN